MKFIFFIGLLLVFKNNSFAQLKISEVLFNPKNGGVDFVEIFNPSSVAIHLDQYYLGNVNNKGEVSNLQRITSENIVIRPGTYKVLTTDPSLILQHYPAAISNNILQMHRFPAYPNTQGHVLLVHQLIDRDRKNEIRTVDSLHYTEKMHSKFIKNPKGISLERLSFSDPTNSPGNFRSSSVSVEGATPGYRNSIFRFEKKWFRMNNKIINPSFGPFKQFEIEYELERANTMANVMIYNQKGKIIKRIHKNKSIATKGTWSWDGKNKSQVLAPIGVYTAYIELYDDTGYRQVIRKSFVLTY